MHNKEKPSSTRKPWFTLPAGKVHWWQLGRVWLAWGDGFLALVLGVLKGTLLGPISEQLA